MPRKAAPWFRAGRGRWYCTIRGQQVGLNVTDPRDEAGAFREMAERLASLERRLTDPDDAPPVRAGVVRELTGDYVAAVRHRVSAKTAVVMADRLGWLSRLFGGDEVGRLEAAAVERAAGREAWRSGTVRKTLSVVQAFVQWCGRPKFRLKIPPPEYRGAECVVSRAEYDAAVARSDGDFAAYLRFLWETGCRPGEARTLTAETVDWAGRQVRLKAHKNAGKGKSRVIVLSQPAVDVLLSRRAAHGSGPLFRNEWGRAFTMQAVNGRWRRLRLAGVVSAPTVYAVRHTYITRALEAGVPAAHVAAACGTSIQMIERTYSHVGQNMSLLRSVVDRVSGAA